MLKSQQLKALLVIPSYISPPNVTEKKSRE